MSCISSIAHLQQTVVSAQCHGAVLAVRAVPDDVPVPVVRRPVLTVRRAPEASVRAASAIVVPRAQMSVAAARVRLVGAAFLRASTKPCAVQASGNKVSAKVRQLKCAQMHSGMMAQAQLKAQARLAAVESSQICPVHYGMNLLADDALTRLMWDDGSQVKW